MTDTISTTADTTPVPQPVPAPVTPEVTPQAPPQPTGIQVPKAEEAPAPSKLEDPVFLSRLSQEALASGDLTAESYAELKAAGIPETLAKQFVKGAIADHQQTLSTINSECGGEAAVQEAVQWAAKNLQQSEIDALNRQLGDANPAVVINTLKGLQARSGNQGSLVAGRTGGNTGPIAYESEAQWKADLKDPRFSSDPAFRAAVTAKTKAAMERGTLDSRGIVNKGRE